jgi:hypothetical protein
MYTALNRLGRTVEFHTFPREPHGFYEPRHVMEEMRLIRGWFDRHVTNGALWPPAYREILKVNPEHLPPSFADLLRETERLPRLYRPGDTLRVERGLPLEAIVTDVDAPESYGEDKPAGRFLEVGVLMGHKGGSKSLELISADVALIEPSGKMHSPVGIPQEGPGGKSLLRVPGFTIRLSPSDDGSWTSMRVTFEIPAERDALALVAGPFPPVLVSVGEAGP